MELSTSPGFFRCLKRGMACLFLLASISTAYSQLFYGMTRSGGPSGAGTIFKVNPDGSGFTTDYSFQIDANAGRSPDYCQLLPITASGATKLYGVTPFRGKYDGGALYAYEPAGNIY